MFDTNVDIIFQLKLITRQLERIANAMEESNQTINERIKG